MSDIDDDFTNFDIPDEDDELVENLGKEFKEIIETINTRRVFYKYPLAVDIIKNELRPRFHDSITDNNDRGRIFFLYGDYNTGKSHLLRYFCALMYKVHRKYWEKNRWPIIKRNIPDNINTANQLYLYLLDQMGKPVDEKQIKEWDKTNVTRTRLKKKVIAELKRLQTRIFILDEVQRLLKAKNPNLSGIFEAIKDLTTKSEWGKSKLRTQFVLCGTPESVLLFDVENWIQGRAHARKLTGLNVNEFSTFLFQIYDDFIGMGISDKWDLVTTGIVDGKEKVKINEDHAYILFDRAKELTSIGLQAKAGFTVNNY